MSDESAGDANYGRIEVFLAPAIQKAISARSFVALEVPKRFEKHVRSDLDSGQWDLKYRDMRTQSYFSGSLVLINSIPE